MIDKGDCPRSSITARVQKGDASTEAIDRSKGGLSTKIHAVVDGLGNDDLAATQLNLINSMTFVFNLALPFNNNT